jgi:3-methyladenine DNA glycosylase AlkD
MLLNNLRQDLRKQSDPEKIAVYKRFFKTGKGEYGEGDEFLGVTVPKSRLIARKYKDLSFGEIQALLKSKIHEERLIALFILVYNFKKGTEEEKKKIFDFYLASTKYINNWDLVDSSAGYIVGGYLHNKPKNILKKLARSKSLWDRRIAVISTFYFLYQKEAKFTFEIAEILIPDKNDLIQKAVGWMLREAGKRCGAEIEEEFLKKHYKNMGRTALRYSIEHFDEQKRKRYLAGAI